MQTKRANASIAGERPKALHQRWYIALRRFLDLSLVLVIALNNIAWAQSPNSLKPISVSSAATPSNPSSSSLQTQTLQPSEVAVVTTDPNQLVLSAIHQAVWGPPIACKVYQSSHAFDQQVVVSGEYKSSGGGTGQFRYTARVSSGETTVDTIQISDGRLMYTQEGSDEAPRRVIIEQVRQTLGNALVHSRDRPEVTIHLAIGGHPELLRNLYHRYRWYKAVQGKLGGVEVWQLVGRLRTEPPKIAGAAPLDQQTFAPLPAGSKLPEIVRLTLGRSASLPYFPFMVEYFRRTDSPDDPSDSLEPVSKLVHTDATTSVTITDKDFVYKVQDSVDRIDDETKLYMPPATIAGTLSFPPK